MTGLILHFQPAVSRSGQTKYSTHVAGHADGEHHCTPLQHSRLHFPKDQQFVVRGWFHQCLARELTGVLLTTLVERKWHDHNQYVNANNGGWTAVGWFQRGRIQTVGAGDCAEVASLVQSVTFHVCRLNPTKAHTTRHIALHNVIANDELHAAINSTGRAGSEDDEI